MSDDASESRLWRHWRYGRLWVRAFWRWLGEARTFWVGLGVLLAVLVIVRELDSSETAFRVSGLVLQLLGIATVMLGIRKTRRQFGHPSIFSAALRWFRRFPYYGTRTVGASLAVSIGGASATGSAQVRAGRADESVEARLTALERDMNGAYTYIGQVQADLASAKRQHESAVDEERKAREAGEIDVRAMLEATQTGGLSLSAVGAAWLFVGVLLSTVAPELSRALS